MHAPHSAGPITLRRVRARRILFGPLTGIEVLGSRIDGTVVVIECAFSINLTALTLEQVLNKRHKLVTDMGDGMVLELRTDLAGSGLEARQAEKLRGDLDSKVLHEVPEAFNEDASFVGAVQLALELKQAAGGEEVLQELQQLGPAALAQAADFVGPD